MPETPLRSRLPWIAVAVTLATSAVLLLGPLWDDARDENPLLRAPGPDWQAILRLGLPTVMTAASLVVALCLPRRPVVAGLAVLVLGYAVVRAPGSMTLWFLPALALTALGWGLAVAGRVRGRQGAPRD